MEMHVRCGALLRHLQDARDPRRALRLGRIAVRRRDGGGSGRGFALLLQLEDVLQPLFVDIAMMDEERAEVMAPAQLRLHLEALLHLRLGHVSLLDGDLSEQPDPVRHAPRNIRSKPAQME